MQWDVLWSEAAEADLDAIWLYIAQADLVAADRQIDRIVGIVGKLSDFPRLGPDRSDVDVGLRGLTRGNYLILYELNEPERQVAILRIIDGRRDIAELFRAAGE
jgi:toxin ParE1/3/4